MSLTFGYQFSDFDPEEIKREEGLVNLDKAIELFNSFPWEEQFEKIEKRSDSNHSSTIPSIYFYKTEVDFLVISATNEDGFQIQNIKDTTFGEVYVANNILDRPNDISVEILISFFINDKLDDILEYYEIEKGSMNPVTGAVAFNKTRLTPLLLILLPIVSFFYYLLKQEDLVVVIIMSLIQLGIILLFIMPKLYLNLTYWRNDKHQSISYHPKKKLLIISKNGLEHNIKRTEIKSCDFIHTSRNQNNFREFTYLRLKTQTESFVITNLTIDSEELIHTMNIRYDDIVVFYPNINYQIDSERDKKRKQKYFDEKRSEFLETCSKWETKKLEEVVGNTDSYADHAVSAAQEILNQRKESNSGV